MLAAVPGPEVQFAPSREEAELRAYLGDAYRHERLQDYQRTLDEEYAACGDEDAFYRTSQGYLYNLTAFAMTGTKLPYLTELTRRLEPGARVLDYGCGIGSDGLMLLEAGYRVEFADFSNPSTEYLRWRLANRGLDAPIHDLDAGVPGGFDAAFAFDVIEHVEDPVDFLENMESRAGLVVVNLLEPEPGDQDLHHHDLPVDELVDRAGGLGLRGYAVLHGRSHLIVYSPERAGPLARLAARMRIARERLRRRRRTQ